MNLDKLSISINLDFSTRKWIPLISLAYSEDYILLHDVQFKQNTVHVTMGVILAVILDLIIKCDAIAVLFCEGGGNSSSFLLCS